ncbi:MAG: hypothetical protein WC841_04260 [Candidatus Shapirobacteria bacterium]|jgi:hypothetical protein
MGDRQNIELVLNSFHSWLEKRSYNPNTIRNYLVDTRKFIAYTEERVVNIFSKAAFGQYVSYLSTQNNSARRLASLNKFCQFALDQKLITSNFFKSALKKHQRPSPTKLVESFKYYLKSQNTPQSNIRKYIKNLLNPPTPLPGVKRPGFSLFNQYLLVSIILIILSGLGYGLYSQTILKAKRQLAYSTANAPKSPTRQFSFQGRLTDQDGNPISSETGIVFKFFDDPTLGVGTSLYTSETGASQVVTPDTNGIFSVIIGKTHGLEIPSSVFSEHTAVWLEITADDEVMDPRQQIATVAYALNSETLQGLGIGPSGVAYRNNVVVLDEQGNLNLGDSGAYVPTIKATNGSLGIEGQGVLIKATDGSGGDITINPDGAGVIQFLTEGTTPPAGIGGFIDATNANLATGNLFSGQVGNQLRGYNFLQFQNYNTGLGDTSELHTRFEVTAAGNVYVGATLSSTNISIGNTLISATATQLNLLDNLAATNGSIIYGNGTKLANSSVGNSGQILASNGADTPTWIDLPEGVAYTASTGITLSGNDFRLNLGSSNVWTGYQTFNGGIGVSGSTTLTNLTVGGTFVSVGSTNTVTNLSADYLDGISSAGFLQIGGTGFFNMATNGLQAIGNTGIGLGGTLDQNTNIGTSSFSLSFLGLGNSQSLYIASSGNVGIGTTAPTNKLEVVNPAGTIQLSINTLSTGDVTMRGKSDGNNAGDAYIIGGAGISNANGGEVYIRGGTRGGGSGFRGGNIYLEGGQYDTSGAGYGGDVYVGKQTYTGNTIGGNVYIYGQNTGAWGSRSDIGNIELLAGAVDYSAGNGGHISITAGRAGSAANGGYVNLITGAGGSSSGNSGALTLGTGNITSGSYGVIDLKQGENYRIRIDSNGDVGIGTTDPLFKLHVVGDGYFTSGLGVSGNVGIGGTLSLTGTNVAVGSTVLYIDSSGIITKGALPAGTVYTASNGITLSGADFQLNLGSSNVWTGYQTFNGGIGVSGSATLTNLTVGGTFVSVGSTNLVTNLNADVLDGLHAASFVGIGSTGDFITTLTGGSGILLSGSGIGRTITNTGVLSINSNTGAFTLSNGLTNYTNAIGLGGTLDQAGFTNINIGSGSSGLSILGVNSNTQALTIRENGYVGIGTTNPGAKLTLSGGNFLQTISGVPEALSTFSIGETAYDIVVSGQYAYVSTYTGMIVLDISNNTFPVITNDYNTAGFPSNAIAIAGKYAYLADGVNTDLQIIDISDPQNLSIGGTVKTGGVSKDIYISGKYAYLADYKQGLQIVDITNPARPIETGEYVTNPGLYNGVSVVNNYAYAVGSAGLDILNISNSTSPSLVSTLSLGVTALDIYADGKYAYIAANTSGLLVVDISNNTSPAQVGSYNTAGNANGVFIAGRYAYVADGTSGLHIIDISNPASPSLVTTYDTPGNAYKAYVHGKYAYIADGTSGIEIIDINGIDTPAINAGNILTNNLNTSENANIGNNLYVRNGLNVGFGGIYSAGDVSLTGSLNLTGTILASGSTGTTGQILSSTQTGLQWIDGIGTTYAAGVGLTLSSDNVLSVDYGSGLGLNGNKIINTGVTWLTGTANQISVSANTGAIGLSLPQNIDTAAMVTFGNLRIGTSLSTVGNVGIGGTLTLSASTVVGSGTTALFIDPTTNVVTRRVLGSMAFDSGTYDNYRNWGLQTNSGDTTPVTSLSQVNFINGVGISISQVGTSITITNTSTGTTYAADNGLHLTGNILGLGGTLTDTGFTNINISAASSGLSFLGINNNTQALTITNTGYVGIGTTNPTAKLDIYGGLVHLTGAANSNKFLKLQNYESTGYAQIYQSASALHFDTLIDKDFRFYTTTTTGATSVLKVSSDYSTQFNEVLNLTAAGDLTLDGTINISGTGTNIFAGGIGITGNLTVGTAGILSAPKYYDSTASEYPMFYLDLNNADANSSSLSLANLGSIKFGAFYSGGWKHSSSDPAAKIESIGGAAGGLLLNVGNTGVGSTANAVVWDRSAIFLSTNGNIGMTGNVTIGSSLTVNSTLNVGGTLIVQDGAGKITVGLIDPPYTINGSKYATWLTAMPGQKEEVVGSINTSQYVPQVGYRGGFKLTSQPVGSDLWLFSKTTNMAENISRLTVLLTPSDSSKVWYELDEANKTIYIYSSSPSKISYRFTAPRWDFVDQDNTRQSDEVGYIIDSPDEIDNLDIQTSLNPADYQHNLSLNGDGIYTLTDSQNNVVKEIGNFFSATIANLKTGAITAKDIVTDNLTIRDKIVSPLVQVDDLEALNITTENIEVKTGYIDSLISKNIKTDNLEVKDATITGTLYADSIVGREGSFGDLMTEKISSLRAEIQKLITAPPEATPSPLLAESKEWITDIASDSAKLTGSLTLTDNLVVGGKLAINGDSQLANAFITGTLSVGDVIIKDNYIDTANTALYLQHSGIGSVHILADTLVISDTGEVTVNGQLNVGGNITATGNITTKDATVSGSLIANMLATQDASISGKLTAKEIDTQKISIATESATIIAADSASPQASSSAQISSNAAAGTLTLPAGKTELTIVNNKLTPNSMVYLTPVGSTRNQVIYLKSKSADSFTIGLDQELDKDIDVNWWIIN